MSESRVFLKQAGNVTPQAWEGTSGKGHVITYIYNPSTMEIEVSTGGSGVGTDVNILNFPANPATSTLQSAGNASLVSILAELQTTLTVATDQASASVLYVGEAVPGSSAASAVWRVKKLTTVGDVATMTYADGNSNFDNVWNNRALLSYS